MASLTRATLFSAGTSPFICRHLTSLSLSIKATHQNSPLSTTQRSTASPELTPSGTITAPVSTPAIDSGNGLLRSYNEVQKCTEAVEDDDVVCGNLSDYFEQAKVLNKSIGGSLRWFSPVECGGEKSRVKDAPLLLYLPENKGDEAREVSRCPKLAVHLADIDDNDDAERVAKMTTEINKAEEIQHKLTTVVFSTKQSGSMVLDLVSLDTTEDWGSRIFDVWCLHIPVADRTCFTGLMKFVESTVRSEHSHLPNRPIYLVGESLGSCLALAVAARNPKIDLVLILANPATSFSKSQLQLLVPVLEFFPTQPFLTIPYLQSLIGGDQMNIFRLALENGNVPEQTGRGLSSGLLTLQSYFSVVDEILPRDTFLWRMDLLKTAAAYVNSRLHAVKSQTLILSSGRDPLFPSQEEGARLRSLLPNCELRKFSDSSHFLFLEDGVDLVYIIKAASFYRRGKCPDYVADYFPPTPSDYKNAYQYGWMETAFSPVMLSTLENGEIVKGLGGIPSEGPVLIVGYHMLLGFELVPLVTKIFSERNILVRGMAHPMMFSRPKDGKLPDLSTFDSFRAMGATPVSGKNLFKLLSSKSHVLLYPGGMREALHRKGEEYKLMWPDQSEFVRMAARYGATIIPFGAVGEDDIAQLVVDYNDLMRIPYLKSQIEELTNESLKLRTSTSGEVANQDVHLPGILPKVPGRLYFLFGKPIQTEGRKEELKDKEKAHELYLHVKSEVEQCLDYLKEKREQDPYRSILARAVFQVTNGSASEIPTFEL